MEKLLGEFIAVVGRENEVLDSLAEIGERKRQLIVLAEVKELDALIQKEGIILSNLEKLEGARFKLQQELATGWGLTGSELVAAGMLDRVKQGHESYYSELSQAIDRLDYNLTRLKAINSNNHELLEQSLDFIAMMESVLEGDVAGTYSDNGDKIDETLLRFNRSLLDKKV